MWSLPGGQTVPTDRRLIRLQLWLGVALVVFGAMLLVIFHLVGMPDSSGSSNIATGVLGVGAAMIPATAAGAASARILAGPSGGQGQVKVGEPTINGTTVTASILAVDHGVGAFIQAADSQQSLTDVTYVPPSPDMQSISFHLSTIPQNTTIRVAVNDNGAVIPGPTVATPPA